MSECRFKVLFKGVRIVTGPGVCHSSPFFSTISPIGANDSSKVSTTNVVEIFDEMFAPMGRLSKKKGDEWHAPELGYIPLKNASEMRSEMLARSSKIVVWDSYH